MENSVRDRWAKLWAWLLSESFRHRALIFLVLFLPISKAAAEICVIASLLSWALSGHIRDIFQKPLVLTPLLLIAVLLSLAGVPQEHLAVAGKGVWKWLRSLSVFWIFYSIMAAQGEKSKKRLADVFLAGMAVVALDGFVQFIFGTDLLRQMTTDPGRMPRMKASLSAPTHLAFFLSLTLPLTAHLIFQADAAKKQISKYFYLAGWLFFLIAFILTFSRGAMIALILSCLLLGFRRRVKPVTGLIVIAGLALLLGAPQIRYNFVETLTAQDLSLRIRLGAWQTAWHMIQDNPLFGIGPNLYHTLIPQYAAAGNTYSGYAHNSYLQLGSELGIFGLLIFLVLMAGTLRMELSKRSFWISKPELHDFLFTGLLSFWMQSFFDNHFFSIQCSLLLAITWAMVLAGYTRPRAVPNPR